MPIKRIVFGQRVSPKKVAFVKDLRRYMTFEEKTLRHLTPQPPSLREGGASFLEGVCMVAMRPVRMPCGRVFPVKLLQVRSMFEEEGVEFASVYLAQDGLAQ